MPPKRIPVPIIIQGPPLPPKLVIVDHHHLVNGPCEEDPCRNSGTCSASGSDFHCVCPLGYKGNRCELQSKCIPSPCKNFGKCTELVNDYECTCHIGFHGKDCDVESKCDPSPCRNGGYCTETRASYICSCKQGFMGKNCEQESKCHPVNPCQNNGFCKEDLTGYKCLCIDSFSGMNCEAGTNNVCDMNPCLNGGTCISETGDRTRFSCSCSPGFSGHACQERGCANCPTDAQCVQGICMSNLTPSQDVPLLTCEHCSINALCKEEKCVCKPMYNGNGLHCRRAKSPCHPNPCENGATCIEESSVKRSETGMYCVCSKGYSAPLCTEHDPCSDYSCHNGGTCQSKNGQPQCKCVSPYQGTTCELDNVCLPSGGKPRNQCLNGGTCQFTNGESQCICPPQYEGDNCNKNKCDKCDINARCNQGVCICKTFFIGDGFTCKEIPTGRGKAPTQPVNQPTFCVPDPCTNGATCIDGKTTFYCVCTEDFYGKTCSQKRPVKVVYKYKNGAKARSKYERAIYSDYNEFLIIDPQFNLCHPNPCLHGGICKEVATTDFECICANPRYKGRFCDVDMCSECDVHARCIHGKCICKDGYEGDGYQCTRAQVNYQYASALKKQITAKPNKTQQCQFPKLFCFICDFCFVLEDIIISEYQSLGCWSDTANWKDPQSRALLSLEGLDPRVSDDYHTRKQPISKCAEIARELGYKFFAIQNGGQCFSGPDGHDFRKFGPSERCRSGVGGSIANDVYKL
ncbi:hypothetical protein QZH41_016907 [Actinostola sp. cb2023]|nr:hypothetical protein QZH41_016907 [Actinostola sp. cb2023]